MVGTASASSHSRPAPELSGRDQPHVVARRRAVDREREASLVAAHHHRQLPRRVGRGRVARLLHVVGGGHHHHARERQPVRIEHAPRDLGAQGQGREHAHAERPDADGNRDSRVVWNGEPDGGVMVTS